jgi:SAM-dependent methyltransferase
MALNSGERQVAPSLDGIRADHVARYRWAASVLEPGSKVIDVGCGIGYGARILADAGMDVIAVDLDVESIEYARAHYGHERIRFQVCDAASVEWIEADAAVCFEMIEHVADPLQMLRRLRAKTPLLLSSVPNEEVFPWENYAFHHRHYTKSQFTRLLVDAGFHATRWFGQDGPESPVEAGVNGRTLVAVAVADEGAGAPTHEVSPPPPTTGLGHVAILGLGPSVRQFLEITKRLGGRRAFCDEVWGINALGDVFACDRIFHMDDVRIQEIRAAAKPQSNIARMLEWLRREDIPSVVTSRAHPDYPRLQEFPLAAVIEEFPLAYFNSTAAYAVAYALHMKATKISLWGMDFTYPDAHDAEKGRACVEFWLGIAAQRGVEIAMPKTTSLMDALEPQERRFYGYDTLHLDIQRTDTGVEITRTEREKLPTAEEIEENYSHKKHPNPLVQG